MSDATPNVTDGSPYADTTVGIPTIMVRLFTLFRINDSRRRLKYDANPHPMGCHPGNDLWADRNFGWVFLTTCGTTRLMHMYSCACTVVCRGHR